MTNSTPNKQYMVYSRPTLTNQWVATLNFTSGQVFTLTPSTAEKSRFYMIGAQ